MGEHLTVRGRYLRVMSATTENLLEQITVIQQAIKVAEDAGRDSSVLRADLKFLNERLQVCNEALVEGRQILKG